MSFPNLFSILESTTMVDKKGHEKPTLELAKNQLIGVYFSAAFCGPCRAFTPFLVQRYEGLKHKGTGFEILFASWDTDTKSFLEYFAKMPWFALAFDPQDKIQDYYEKDTIKKLSEAYKVDQIPTLLLFDQKGNLLSREGRTLVQNDQFPIIPAQL